MPKPTTDILAAFPGLLLEGRLNEIVVHFALPTIVQVKDANITLVTRDHALAVMTGYRARLYEAGVAAIAAREIGSQPLSGHFDLRTIHTVVMDADGRELDEGIIRYCVGRREIGASIELIQYVRPPLGLSLSDVQPMAAIA